MFSKSLSANTSWSANLTATRQTNKNKTLTPIPEVDGHVSKFFNVTERGNLRLVSRALKENLDTWDPQKRIGGLMHTISGRHVGEMKCVAISPDNKLVTAGSPDGTAHIWDLATGEHLKALEGHTNKIESLVITHDNKLITGSTDCTVRVWDLTTGDPLQTLIRPTTIKSILLIPGNKVMTAGTHDGHMEILNLDDGHVLCTLAGHGYGNEITSCALMADNRLVSGATDGTVKIWDLDTAREVHTLVLYASSVNSLAVTSDNKLISTSPIHNKADIFDLRTGALLRTLTGHTSKILSLMLTSDNRVVTASRDGTVKIWDLTTSVCLHTLKGHETPVSSLAINSDNKLATSSWDNKLNIWDIEKQEIGSDD